jgi:hypothetical protein
MKTYFQIIIHSKKFPSLDGKYITIEEKCWQVVTFEYIQTQETLN